jgi:DNA-binding SARP family transcriptional activator
MNRIWTSQGYREHYNLSTRRRVDVDSPLITRSHCSRIALPESIMGNPAYLRCLGQPALLDASGTPIRLRTQKQLALLIYLVLEGRTPVRRDRLADLLWSNVGIKEARHSMGTALWGLRNRVGPKAFPGNAYTLRTTVQLDCDLDRLRRGEVLETEFLPALEVDAFLEDFEIPDAPPFNHWRDQQRARLWPAIEAALVRQMDHCRRTGDFIGIEPLAERTLRHNALSEAAIRARIEARAFAGDRIGALQAFETWKQSLETELRAQPSEQLEAMAKRLRRGTLEGGGDGNRPRVPTEQWRDRTFIGRTTEYQTLYEAWERTTRGDPTHALVLGESGIGKSTLVQRLMMAASLDGAVTSRVQCYELEREIPYAALGALVRGLLERPEAMATSPQSLADLAQAVPALREQFPNLPAALQLQGESFRIRITDAMEALLRTIAEETAVMLVVDDFHMADDASLSVIHLLARRFESERVMIVLAARPSGQNESPSIARLRESHSRLGFVSLEVPPMAPDEAAEMLDSLTADRFDPGKSIRDAMLRAAGGYPMALELFVSEWIRSGESSLALAVPAMREELGQRSPPKDAYRMALDRIREGLDASTRLALQLAAVLGPRLNDFSMYKIVDLGIGTTGQAMEALRSARLLRETEERLEFVNELTRGHAYLGIPKPMRTALHGEVVTRLLGTEAEGGKIPGLEIAWHLIRAGRPDEATPYLLRGARESMRGGAPHEAERGLATAMDRLVEPDKSEALLLIGEALQEQGRMRESIAFLDRVNTASRSEVLARCNVLLLYAQQIMNERTAERSRDIAVHLLQASRAAEEPSTRLRALWIAARLFREYPDATLLSDVWNELEQEEFETLSLEDRGEYALGKALCLYFSGDKARSLETIDQIIGDLEVHKIKNSVYLALLLGRCAIHSSLGEYEVALAIGERGVSAAREMGEERRLRYFLANIALFHCRLGNPEAQLEWAAQASGEKWEPKDNILDQNLHYLMAQGYALRGETKRALEELSRGDATLRSIHQPWVRQSWQLRAADVYLILGRTKEAQESAKAALTGDFRKIQSNFLAGPFARWLARAAINGAIPIEQARSGIQELQSRQESLDYFDQVAVLNAKVWLDSKNGHADEGEREEMWRRIVKLPVGAANELRALGMLAF